MRYYLRLILLLFLPLACLATEQPLPVDEAFKLSVVPGPEQLQLHWQIAEGTYLYQDRIKLNLASPTETPLGKIEFPTGLPRHNSLLGDFSAYEKSLTLVIPLLNDQALTLKLEYQGCAKTGFCYPPQTRLITWQKPRISIINPEDSQPLNSQDKITQLLSSHNYLWILLGFLGFGLLLAFTPCVFPMVPILSSLIVGQNEQLTMVKAFLLSLTYVLAMALTYALAGILAASAGSYLQALLQTPWVIAAFSLLFGLLALSLFGLYNLQLPAGLQAKLISLSNRQQGGRYLGVAVMGSLATLIVSPCVSAPLVGALGYIGQTGDSLLGGLALFMLGLGMGIPLLVIGTSAGRWLPKSGPWLEVTKNVFGVLLLAVAISLLSRISPHWLIFTLWSLLIMLIGGYFWVLKSRWGRYLGTLILGIAVIVMLVNLSTALHISSKQRLQFDPIHNNLELNQALLQAKLKTQPVIVDFYADWCVACKAMESDVLAKVEVQQNLATFKRLRVDVTALTPEHKQLMQRLNVIAPPTFIFFADEQELAQYRLVGEVKEQKFNQHLLAVLYHLNHKTSIDAKSQ